MDLSKESDRESIDALQMAKTSFVSTFMASSYKKELLKELPLSNLKS